MKWSVIGLILIGLVSATCVAILVASIPGNQEVAPKPENACLLESTAPLEQGTLITAEHLVMREVPKGHTPEDVLPDKGQVIGKVLITSMSKGQTFTKACFPAQGAGLELASHLPKGMRAVSMEISDSFGLRGLLYPGCTVDILVSLRSLDQSDAISKTLLEEIRVLAIGSRTVSSVEKVDIEKTNGQHLGNMMVTVLVSTEQAQQLQLAARHGTLSLAMRNPNDTITIAQEPTRLDTLLGKKEVPPAPVVITPPKIEIKPKEPEKTPPPPKPKWQVTVIQGQTTSEVEFAVPKL
ncbi:MAG: Flp pilus assembly protein CpaB [Phycisphaerales bacterium]|jgi:pilus assembly protein CpaB|nr:Flp pilus assembly protein CpaB [Phycisphaerales bacterium]